MYWVCLILVSGNTSANVEVWFLDEGPLRLILGYLNIKPFFSIFFMNNFIIFFFRWFARRAFYMWWKDGNILHFLSLRETNLIRQFSSRLAHCCTHYHYHFHTYFTWYVSFLHNWIMFFCFIIKSAPYQFGILYWYWYGLVGTVICFITCYFF